MWTKERAGWVEKYDGVKKEEGEEEKKGDKRR